MSETVFPLQGLSRAGARWGWAFAGAVVLAQAAGHLLNELALSERHRWLNAAVDASIFGRANTLSIVLCAAIAGLGVALGTRTRPRLLLCLALVLLAVDDATGVHDRLRRLPRAEEAVAAAGFALLLVLVLVLLAAEAIHAAGAARRLLGVGILALAAAVAVRVAGAYAHAGSTLGGTTKAIAVAVEQGLDLGGWILVGAGLLAAVAARAQPSSPPPHWPALTATLTGNPDRASMTAVTLPDGVAKSRRPRR
jgi:MFS family permease